MITRTISRGIILSLLSQSVLAAACLADMPPYHPHNPRPNPKPDAVTKSEGQPSTPAKPTKTTKDRGDNTKDSKSAK